LILRSVFNKEEGAPTEDTLAFLQKSLVSIQKRQHPGASGSTSTRGHEEERIITRTHLEEANLEDISIQFLATYSTHSTWRQTVSLINDYGQTLAHLSVVFGFLRLLQYLVVWGIDLQVQDDIGLTALHYAYFFQQEKCLVFLVRSGANRFVLDHLGRTPSDLAPQLDTELRMGTLDLCVGDASDPSFSHHTLVTDRNFDTPGEVEMLNAKYILVQRWVQQVQRDLLPFATEPHLKLGPTLLGDWAGTRTHPIIQRHCNKCGKLESSLGLRFKRCARCGGRGVNVFYCVRVFPFATGPPVNSYI